MATTATAPRPTSSGHPTRTPTTTAHDGPSRLPKGWRHAVAVRWLLDQPRERREAVQAGLFALVAAIWAPLGVLAFLAQVFVVFAVVSLLLTVVVAAPRPTALAHLSSAVRTHVAPVLRDLRPVLRSARRDLGTAIAHVRRELPTAFVHLRDDLAPTVRRASDRTAGALATATAGVRRGAAHVRERLAELGPSPAQSSSRSAR